MTRLIFLIILLSLLEFSCSTAEKKKDSLQDARIAAALDTLVADNAIPGINLSIIDSSGTIRNFASGYAEPEKGIRMEPGHVMFSGSIGKTYCVATLMQLVDEGSVDLKRKFIDYFPSVEWLWNLPGIGDITVEMLLQHTSGLPRYVMKPGVWDALQSDPDKIWTYEERLSFIFGDDPVHEPGEGWSYSDTNYILIGMLVEEITGIPYYDNVKERILKPGKLNFTYPADRRDIPGLPEGYSRLPAMFRMPYRVVENGKYVFNPQMEWTGGGMASTAEDLARWAKLYYDAEIVPEKLQLMIVTPNRQAPLVPGREGYGMGSFIFDTKHGIAYGHTGFVPGFNSVFAWYTDLGIAIAMQVNCDYATSKMSLVDYLDRIIDEIY